MSNEFQDVVLFNKDAWNRQVRKGNQWTVPVTAEQVAEARSGVLKLLLTPDKLIPEDWYPSNRSAKILGLASGGGQQGPLLAAAGYDVTIFDNSPLQLQRDREVAEREGLVIRTVEGDMADLSCFANETFDFIIHPCSNCFVADVNPVWQEAYRVLKKGGTIIAGFTNPVVFTLDLELEKQGVAQMKYSLPYSDLKDLSAEERLHYFGPDEPLTFSHTLEDQIGGQLRAGFHVTGYYEDSWTSEKSIVSQFVQPFIATRALKL